MKSQCTYKFTGKQPSEIDTHKVITDTIKEVTVDVWRKGIEEAPRKTGVLKASIQVDMSKLSVLTTRIFSSLKYAEYVHEGTGIYGPKGQPFDIFPVNKKALKFVMGGKTIFAKHCKVMGQKANPFLDRALEGTEMKMESIFDRRLKVESG